MARLRFPGRPGFRFDRVGVRYGADEARQTTDPTLAVIASIHKGLCRFRDLFGDSDEEGEEFLGFTSKEVKAAKHDLACAIKKEKQLIAQRAQEQKYRFERSQAALASLAAAGVEVPRNVQRLHPNIKKTFNKLVNTGLVQDVGEKLQQKPPDIVAEPEDAVKIKENDKPVPRKVSALKRVKLKRLTHNIDTQPLFRRPVGRPRKHNIVHDGGGGYQNGSSCDTVAAASSSLFNTKPSLKYKSAAKQILARATKQAAQTSNKLLLTPTHKVRKFVLPTKSSRSSRVIKPNKRFLEDDSINQLVAKQPKLSPVLPLPATENAPSSTSIFGLGVGGDTSTTFSAFQSPGLSLSPFSVNREKCFSSFLSAPQPSGTSSFMDGLANQKPLGSLDQPLIVEGKRPRKPSLIMRMKLVEDDPDDEIRLQQQLSDITSPAKPASSFSDSQKLISEAKFSVPNSTSVPKGYGMTKSLIAPAKLFTDQSSSSSNPFKYQYQKIGLGVPSQNTVVLRQAKLQLNQTALNRSKAALARSLKAKLKREAKLERKNRKTQKRLGLLSVSAPQAVSPGSSLSQLSPFSKLASDSAIEKQKCGLFEGIEAGAGSFSPGNFGSPPVTPSSVPAIKPEKEEPESYQSLSISTQSLAIDYIPGTKWKCLVCSDMCIIKRNRKLPQVPLCKSCKKSYFFQLASGITYAQKKKCTRGGMCIIHFSEASIHHCIPCKFQKFTTIIRRCKLLGKFTGKKNGENTAGRKDVSVKQEMRRHSVDSSSTMETKGSVKKKSADGLIHPEIKEEPSFPLKKVHHTNGDSSTLDRRKKHKSGDSDTTTPGRQRHKHKSGDKIPDPPSLKCQAKSPSNSKEFINANNLDKPLSVDVGHESDPFSLSPPQTLSSSKSSPDKGMRSPSKKPLSSADGMSDRNGNEEEDDRSLSRGTSRGPRIKHVCRRAAMVFPQQRATFPEDPMKSRTLTLSALPNEEKQQLWAKTKNKQDKAKDSSSEDSSDEKPPQKLSVLLFPDRKLASPREDKSGEIKRERKTMSSPEKKPISSREEKPGEERERRVSGNKIVCASQTITAIAKKVRKRKVLPLVNEVSVGLMQDGNLHMRQGRKKIGLAIKNKGWKRKIRCRECKGCKTPECGVCVFCRDKPKFGGPGSLKKCCIHSVCTAPKIPRKAIDAFIDPKSPLKTYRRDDDDNSGDHHTSNQNSGTGSRESSTRFQERRANNHHVVGGGEGAKDNGEENFPHDAGGANELAILQANGGNCSSSFSWVQNGLDMDGPHLNSQTLTGAYSTNRKTVRYKGKYSPAVQATIQLALADVRTPFMGRLTDSFVGRMGGLKRKEKISVPQKQPLMELKPVQNETAYSFDVPLKTHLITADYREDYDVNTAWSHGFSLTVTGPSCLRSLCYLCGSAGKQEMLYCIVCCQPYHSFCLEEEERPEDSCTEEEGDDADENHHSNSNTISWCCRRCQFCHVCGQQNGLLKCHRCKDTYHPGCLGPNYPTHPSRKNIWVCTKCVRCKSCGATTPGVGTNATWTYDFSLCYECGKLMDKGNFCPICHKCYSDDDWESKMVQCAMCESWVHAKCEELTDEMYQLVSFLPEEVQYTCRVCSTERPAYWERVLKSEFSNGLSNVLNALISSKCAQMLLESGPPREAKRTKQNKGKISDGTKAFSTEDNIGTMSLENSATDSILGEVLKTTESPVTSSTLNDVAVRPMDSSSLEQNEKTALEPGHNRDQSNGNLNASSARHVSPRGDDEIVEKCDCEEVSGTSDYQGVRTKKDMDTSRNVLFSDNFSSTDTVSRSTKSHLPHKSQDDDSSVRKSPHSMIEPLGHGDKLNSFINGQCVEKFNGENNDTMYTKHLEVPQKESQSSKNDFCDTSSDLNLDCSSAGLGQKTSSIITALSCTDTGSVPTSLHNGLFRNDFSVPITTFYSNPSKESVTKMLFQSSDTSASDFMDRSKNLPGHNLESAIDLQAEYTSGHFQSGKESCRKDDNDLMSFKPSEDGHANAAAAVSFYAGGSVGDSTSIPQSDDHDVDNTQLYTSPSTSSLQLMSTATQMLAVSQLDALVSQMSQTQQEKTPVKKGASLDLHVSFEKTIWETLDRNGEYPRDFYSIKVKLDSGLYTTVEEFSEDIVRIVQALLFENEQVPTRKKQANSVRSIFIKQMERCFPWFNVNTCKLWEHNRGLPAGMLKDAVLPPSSDHTYAQWLERKDTPMSPQPSPFKKISAPPKPITVDEGSTEACSTFEAKGVHKHSEDTRACLLCQKLGDDEPDHAGRLLYCGQDDWIHINCALWSAEVFEATDGSLQNLQDAVSRGRKLKCNICQQPGATVGCCEANCRSNFHFMCARASECAFQEDKTIFCKLHRDCVTMDVVTKGNFDIARRVCVDLDKIRGKSSWGKAVDPATLNVIIGSCTVESLGVLMSHLSDTEECLYPVDFRCTRIYWSTQDARRRCVYTCRIVEMKPETHSPGVRIQDMRIVHDENHPDFVPFGQLNLENLGIPNFMKHNNKGLGHAGKNDDMEDVIFMGSDSCSLTMASMSLTSTSHILSSQTASSSLRNSSQFFSVQSTQSEDPLVLDEDHNGLAKPWPLTSQTKSHKIREPKPIDLSGLSPSTLALLNIKDPANYIPPQSKQPKGALCKTVGSTGLCSSVDEELGLVKIAERLNNAASKKHRPSSTERDRGNSISPTPSWCTTPLKQFKMYKQQLESSKSQSSSPISFSPPVVEWSSSEDKLRLIISPPKPSRGRTPTVPNLMCSSHLTDAQPVCNVRARSESPFTVIKPQDLIGHDFRSASVSPPMSSIDSHMTKSRTASLPSLSSSPVSSSPLNSSSKLAGDHNTKEEEPSKEVLPMSGSLSPVLKVPESEDEESIVNEQASRKSDLDAGIQGRSFQNFSKTSFRPRSFTPEISSQSITVEDSSSIDDISTDSLRSLLESVPLEVLQGDGVKVVVVTDNEDMSEEEIVKLASSVIEKAGKSDTAVENVAESSLCDEHGDENGNEQQEKDKHKGDADQGTSSESNERDSTTGSTGSNANNSEGGQGSDESSQNTSNDSQNQSSRQVPCRWPSGTSTSGGYTVPTSSGQEDTQGSGDDDDRRRPCKDRDNKREEDVTASDVDESILDEGEMSKDSTSAVNLGLPEGNLSSLVTPPEEHNRTDYHAEEKRNEADSQMFANFIEISDDEECAGSKSASGRPKSQKSDCNLKSVSVKSPDANLEGRQSHSSGMEDSVTGHSLQEERNIEKPRGQGRTLIESDDDDSTDKLLGTSSTFQILNVSPVDEGDDTANPSNTEISEEDVEIIDLSDSDKPLKLDEVEVPSVGFGMGQLEAKENCEPLAEMSNGDGTGSCNAVEVSQFCVEDHSECDIKALQADASVLSSLLTKGLTTAKEVLGSGPFSRAKTNIKVFMNTQDTTDEESDYLMLDDFSYSETNDEEDPDSEKNLAEKNRAASGQLETNSTEQGGAKECSLSASNELIETTTDSKDNFCAATEKDNFGEQSPVAPGVSQMQEKELQAGKTESVCEEKSKWSSHGEDVSASFSSQSVSEPPRESKNWNAKFSSCHEIRIKPCFVALRKENVIESHLLQRPWSENVVQPSSQNASSSLDLKQLTVKVRKISDRELRSLVASREVHSSDVSSENMQSTPAATSSKDPHLLSGELTESQHSKPGQVIVGKGETESGAASQNDVFNKEDSVNLESNCHASNKGKPVRETVTEALGGESSASYFDPVRTENLVRAEETELQPSQPETKHCERFEEAPDWPSTNITQDGLSTTTLNSPQDKPVHNDFDQFGLNENTYEGGAPAIDSNEMIEPGDTNVVINELEPAKKRMGGLEQGCNKPGSNFEVDKGTPEKEVDDAEILRVGEDEKEEDELLMEEEEEEELLKSDEEKNGDTLATARLAEEEAGILTAAGEEDRVMKNMGVEEDKRDWVEQSVSDLKEHMDITEYATAVSSLDVVEVDSDDENDGDDDDDRELAQLDQQIGVEGQANSISSSEQHERAELTSDEFLHEKILEKIKAESLARSSPGKEGPFKCPTCKRMYRTRESYEYHIRDCDFEVSTSEEEERPAMRELRSSSQKNIANDERKITSSEVEKLRSEKSASSASSSPLIEPLSIIITDEYRDEKFSPSSRDLSDDCSSVQSQDSRRSSLRKSTVTQRNAAPAHLAKKRSKDSKSTASPDGSTCSSLLSPKSITSSRLDEKPSPKETMLEAVGLVSRKSLELSPNSDMDGAGTSGLQTRTIKLQPRVSPTALTMAPRREKRSPAQAGPGGRPSILAGGLPKAGSASAKSIAITFDPVVIQEVKLESVKRKRPRQKRIWWVEKSESENEEKEEEEEDENKDDSEGGGGGVARRTRHRGSSEHKATSEKEKLGGKARSRSDSPHLSRDEDSNTDSEKKKPTSRSSSKSSERGGQNDLNSPLAQPKLRSSQKRSTVKADDKAKIDFDEQMKDKELAVTVGDTDETKEALGEKVELTYDNSDEVDSAHGFVLGRNNLRSLNSKQDREEEEEDGDNDDMFDLHPQLDDSLKSPPRRSSRPISKTAKLSEYLAELKKEKEMDSREEAKLFQKDPAAVTPTSPTEPVPVRRGRGRPRMYPEKERPKFVEKESPGISEKKSRGRPRIPFGPDEGSLKKTDHVEPENETGPGAKGKKDKVATEAELNTSVRRNLRSTSGRVNDRSTSGTRNEESDLDEIERGGEDMPKGEKCQKEKFAAKSLQDADDADNELEKQPSEPDVQGRSRRKMRKKSGDGDKRRDEVQLSENGEEEEAHTEDLGVAKGRTSRLRNQSGERERSQQQREVVHVHVHHSNDEEDNNDEGIGVRTRRERVQSLSGNVDTMAKQSDDVAQISGEVQNVECVDLTSHEDEEERKKIYQGCENGRSGGNSDPEAETHSNDQRGAESENLLDSSEAREPDVSDQTGLLLSTDKLTGQKLRIIIRSPNVAAAQKIGELIKKTAMTINPQTSEVIVTTTDSSKPQVCEKSFENVPGAEKAVEETSSNDPIRGETCGGKKNDISLMDNASETVTADAQDSAEDAKNKDETPLVSRSVSPDSVSAAYDIQSDDFSSETSNDIDDFPPPHTSGSERKEEEPSQIPSTVSNPSLQIGTASRQDARIDDPKTVHDNDDDVVIVKAIGLHPPEQNMALKPSPQSYSMLGHSHPKLPIPPTHSPHHSTPQQINISTTYGRVLSAPSPVLQSGVASQLPQQPLSISPSRQTMHPFMSLRHQASPPQTQGQVVLSEVLPGRFILQPQSTPRQELVASRELNQSGLLLPNTANQPGMLLPNSRQSSIIFQTPNQSGVIFRHPNPSGLVLPPANTSTLLPGAGQGGLSFISLNPTNPLASAIISPLQPLQPHVSPTSMLQPSIGLTPLMQAASLPNQSLMIGQPFITQQQGMFLSQLSTQPLVSQHTEHLDLPRRQQHMQQLTSPNKSSTVIIDPHAHMLSSGLNQAVLKSTFSPPKSDVLTNSAASQHILTAHPTLLATAPTTQPQISTLPISLPVTLASPALPGHRTNTGTTTLAPLISFSAPIISAPKLMNIDGTPAQINYMGTFDLSSSTMQSVTSTQSFNQDASKRIMELVQNALNNKGSEQIPGVEVKTAITHTAQGPKKVMRVFISEDVLPVSKSSSPAAAPSPLKPEQPQVIPTTSSVVSSLLALGQMGSCSTGSHLSSADNEWTRIVSSSSQQPQQQNQSLWSSSSTGFVSIPINPNLSASSKLSSLASKSHKPGKTHPPVQFRRALQPYIYSYPLKRKVDSSSADEGSHVKKLIIEKNQKDDGTYMGTYKEVVSRQIVSESVTQSTDAQDSESGHSVSGLLQESELGEHYTRTLLSGGGLIPTGSGHINSGSESSGSILESELRQQLPTTILNIQSGQQEHATTSITQQLLTAPPQQHQPHHHIVPQQHHLQMDCSPHKRASFPLMSPTKQSLVAPLLSHAIKGRVRKQILQKSSIRKDQLSPKAGLGMKSSMLGKRMPSAVPRRLKTAFVASHHPLIHHKKSMDSLPQPSLEEEVVATPLDLGKGDHLHGPGGRRERERSQSRLRFEVNSDDGFSCQGDTIEDAWNQVLEKVQDVRAAARMKQLSYAGISGRSMFGVDHDAVVYLIEQLYGAVHCHRNYKFKFHKYDLDQADEEVAINLTGAARSEAFQTRKPFDMFNFLKSVYRTKPGDDEREKEEEMALKSSRRATSLSLPMAMRFRKLKTFAKEAVDVYRSKIHGRGLFCKRNIDAGEMVIEYAGEVIRASLTDKREKYYESKGIGCYMFRIDDDEVVDATMHGSAARFINHSCEPNCFSKVILVDGKKHIVIFAMRPIKRGEELTYDYKFPIEEVKIPCSCGSKRCRKYLN